MAWAENTHMEALDTSLVFESLELRDDGTLGPAGILTGPRFLETVPSRRCLVPPLGDTTLSGLNIAEGQLGHGARVRGNLTSNR